MTNPGEAWIASAAPATRRGAATIGTPAVSALGDPHPALADHAGGALEHGIVGVQLTDPSTIPAFTQTSMCGSLFEGSPYSDLLDRARATRLERHRAERRHRD